MAGRRKSPLRKIRRTNVIYPIAIGLGVVGYLLYREFDPEVFNVIDFAGKSVFWLLIAFVLMAIRDIGYMIRLMILSDQSFSWRQAFRVIMLWEFTSAITPSAIGGTSFAILYVNKEGLSVGKSSAVVMATSFLDELYFIILFPVLLLTVNAANLFITNGSADAGNVISFTNEFFYFAVIGYSLKFLYTIVVSYGLFYNPRGLKWLLLWIFKLPILRKWRQGANEAGTDIVTSSRELKSKPFSFWIKAFTATFFSWTARYWVVNALLVAFFLIHDHFLIFARQLVMWIMMVISPTPGGSGFAEYVFTEYLGEFIPVTANLETATAVAMAFVWRLISYYPYLIIGAIILPRWLKLKFATSSIDKIKKVEELR